MRQACVARGATRDFGTAHYPVGLFDYPGCHFCEEYEGYVESRDWRCRKYPEASWAWSIDPNAKKAREGYWYEWSYRPSDRCTVPDFGRDERGDPMHSPPFANCTQAAFAATHSWCDCSSQAFDELVERTPICAQLKSHNDIQASFARQAVKKEAPAVPLLGDFDVSFNASTGAVSGGRHCWLGRSGESCPSDAIHAVGLRVAVIGPQGGGAQAGGAQGGDEVGSVSIDGNPKSHFLGLHDETIYTAVGGPEGSALSRSLGAKIDATGLLRHFPIGVAQEGFTDDTNSWRGATSCRSSPDQMHYVFEYTLQSLELTMDDDWVSEADAEWKRGWSAGLAEPYRCNQPNGRDRMYPRFDVEGRLFPARYSTAIPASTHPSALAGLHSGHNTTVDHILECWHSDSTFAFWKRSRWRGRAIYIASNRTSVCISERCQTTRCDGVNASEVSSGDGYNFGSGPDDAAMANHRCDGVLPAVRARCDATRSALSHACAAGGTWRATLPPTALEGATAQPAQYCDDNLCTSIGNDCCAPWGEPRTCGGGFEPKPTGECGGDPSGTYTCCSSAGAPPPPPLVDSLFPAGWAQAPFSHAFAHSSNGSAPLEDAWTACLPPLCYNFDAGSGGTQPTRLDASTGQTVPDCAIGSAGLAPYLTAIEALYPCSIRDPALSAATARHVCALASASLAPAHMPIHVMAPLEAKMMPECTAAHMLPGACARFDPYASATFGKNDLCADTSIRSSCDGGNALCNPATCPMLGYFLAPHYERYTSRAAFFQTLVDRQQAVRTQDSAVELPYRPQGLAGRDPVRSNDRWDRPQAFKSSELEQLFPSIALEFGSLDVSNLRGDLTIAMPIGDANTYEFIRAPRAWEKYDNETTWHSTLWHDRRGFGTLFGGTRNLLPTLQLWWVNALGRAGLKDAQFSISTAIKGFPEFVRAPAFSNAFAAELITPLNAFFLPLGTSLAMPLIVSVLVAEKAGKQRALMVMMGMRMRWYWLGEVLWDTFLVSLMNGFFFIVCCSFNVKSMLRSAGVFVLVLVLWVRGDTRARERERERERAFARHLPPLPLWLQMGLNSHTRSPVSLAARTRFLHASPPFLPAWFLLASLLPSRANA